MVCRMYHLDHWQRYQSWRSYVCTGQSRTSSTGLQVEGFTAYDAYTNLLRDAEGNISGPATVAAGFGTGITESLVAVTPFESIKTQLYISTAYDTSSFQSLTKAQD